MLLKNMFTTRMKQNETCIMIIIVFSEKFLLVCEDTRSLCTFVRSQRTVGGEGAQVLREMWWEKGVAHHWWERVTQRQGPLSGLWVGVG